MMDVLIRSYRSSDLCDCRVLWAELTQHHRELYGDPSIGGESPGLLFDEHLAEVGPERVWVTEKDEEVAGFVGLVVDGNQGVIEPIVVSSTLRDQGIGRALMDRVVEEAKAIGVRYLSVKPVARNVKAISFFYNAGFRKLGQLEMFMDLEPSKSGKWKSGVELFGNTFDY